MPILAAARRILPYALALAVGCRRSPPPPPPVPPPGPSPSPSPRDAGADAAPFAKEPIELLLRAAQLADEQGDSETTLAIGKLIAGRLSADGARLHVRPLVGLYDPLSPDAEAVSAIAADGSRAAVGHGRALSIVDFTHGVRLRPLALLPEVIRRVEIAADGRTVAVEIQAAAGDRSLRLFRPPLATPLVDRPLPAESELDFSADAQLLLVTTREGAGSAVQVLDNATGAVLHTVKYSRPLRLLTTRFDGTLVTVEEAASEPQFLSARSGAPLPPTAPATPCRVAAGPHGAALLSPDREALLLAPGGRSACLWDLRERRLRRGLTLSDVGGDVRSLRALLPGGSVLATSREPGAALYDLRPPRPLRLAPPPSLGLLRSGAGVVPLHDGGTLFLTEAGAALQVFRFDGQRLERLGHTEPGGAPLPQLFGPVATSGDGRRALYVPRTPSAESAAVVFSVSGAAGDGRVHQTRLPLALAGPHRLALTADFLAGDRRLAVLDSRATLVVFEMPAGAIAFTTPAAVADQQGVLRLAAGTLRIEPGGGGYSTVGEVPDLDRHLVCLLGAQPLPFAICEKALRRPAQQQPVP